MRISVYGIAFGLTCAAAVAAPFVPSSWMADILQAPSARAVPQLMESGANAVGKLFSTAALADETPAQPIDFSRLIKVGERPFEISYDGSVSTEMISNARVTKIGFGQVSEVNIITTRSGTYSTDGLFSPHVLYPGIKVKPASTDSVATGGVFGAVWKTGFGWMTLPLDPAGSIISHGPIMGGGKYLATGNDGTCVTGVGYTTCG